MATPKHNDVVTIDLCLDTFHADPATMSLFRHAAFEKDSPSVFSNPVGFNSSMAPPPPSLSSAAPWMCPLFVIRPTMDPLTPPCDSATAACDAIRNLPDRLEGMARDMRMHLDMVQKFAAGHPAKADFERMKRTNGGHLNLGSGNAGGNGNNNHRNKMNGQGGGGHINDAASTTSHATNMTTATTNAAMATGNENPAINSRIQVQALTSRVEELEHEISRLRGRADAHQHRINGIEGGLRSLSSFGNRGGGGGGGGGQGQMK